MLTSCLGQSLGQVGHPEHTAQREQQERERAIIPDATYDLLEQLNRTQASFHFPFCLLLSNSPSHQEVFKKIPGFIYIVKLLPDSFGQRLTRWYSFSSHKGFSHLSPYRK